MSCQVVLCPTASSGAQLNFETSVNKAAPVDGFVHERLVKLGAAEDGRVRAWGTSLRSSVQWKKARPGDLLLFAKNATIFAHAKCHVLVDFPELALVLWKSAQWRYLFILEPPTFIELPASRINEALNYAPKYRIQRLQTLSEEQSLAVIAALSGNPVQRARHIS